MEESRSYPKHSVSKMNIEKYSLYNNYFSFFSVGNTISGNIPVVCLPQQPVGFPVQFFCDFWQNELFGQYIGVESPEGLWLRVQDSEGKSW
jgi:hypothetical protein